jgi:magnesium-transporting ATPase (P-type)
VCLDDKTTEWCWKSVDREITVKLTNNPRLIKDSVKQMILKYDLCITGAGYDYLEKNDESLLNEIIAQVRIYARMSPKQKASFYIYFTR